MHNLHTLFLLAVICSSSLAVSQRSDSKWQTLDGNPPKVVARGGFPGIFPDSSYVGYNLALMTSLPDVILLCDVQLTKDAQGICFPHLRLENGSNIQQVSTQNRKTHVIDGTSTTGYFTVDFTFHDLTNVSLTQGIYSRTDKFDGSLFQIMTVDEIAQLKPPGFWLTVQHDDFYSQQNISMSNYVLSVTKSAIVTHISSPNGKFLGTISPWINRNVTKLILQFLEPDKVEPLTNQTYKYLLQNLAMLNKIADGILISKTIIWPVDITGYLLTYTSVVADAHKAGLQVFASDFANDNPYSYNFSFDPVAEYIQFIDNGVFSVDGVLSDFPITPSEAIDCFSHIGKNDSGKATPLIISFCGSSGDYPACTDVAYTSAMSVGVDVIGCPVQISQDGVPFCMRTINLIDVTNDVQTNFMNLLTTIPEIDVNNGICTFNLTWSQIQQLTPQISNPFAQSYALFSDPANKNSGKFLTLSEFLDMARNSTLSGVLVSIENAGFLMENLGFDIINAVDNALKIAGYNNQTDKKVLIQSTNSAVLNKFKGKGYETVFAIDENISDATDSAISDIKKVADSVVINKMSVFPATDAFTIRATDVIQKLQSSNVSVNVKIFQNQFVSQPWDFFSDATVEINSFVIGAGADGLFTEFPKTAVSYRKNKCLGLGKNTPVYMTPVQAGGLLQLISPQYMPPTFAPSPSLIYTNVVDPPLPSVLARPPISSQSNSSAKAPSSRNTQPKNTVSKLVLCVAMLIVSAMVR